MVARKDLAQRMESKKIIEEFGCSVIDAPLIERFERVTNQRAHPFLRRGFFISHRDFEKVLDDYEQKKPIYIYTGRGPSAGSFHLGHLVPFLFTKYLQDVFDAFVVIQITDDEKFLFRGIGFEELATNSESNILDILACGFNLEKTFIFNNFDYAGEMYKNIVQIQDRLTINQVTKTFGLSIDDCSIGKLAFVATQCAPAMWTSFPSIFEQETRCLVPQGIDQDPYFRLARDVLQRLGFIKPSCIHSTFLPALNGVSNKMSSTDPTCAIFLTDNAETIQRKIASSFSGGQVSLKDQKKLGADLSIDVAYQYLRFFLDDDQKLCEISLAYGDSKSLALFGYKGETPVEHMQTKELKKIVSDLLSNVIGEHQKRRRGFERYFESRKLAICASPLDRVWFNPKFIYPHTPRNVMVRVTVEYDPRIVKDMEFNSGDTLTVALNKIIENFGLRGPHFLMFDKGPGELVIDYDKTIRYYKLRELNVLPRK